MRFKVKEFIDKDGYIIKGDTPIVHPKSSAKKTTDQSVKMRVQPYNYTIYNVKLQETDLEYSEKLRELENNPKKFHEFLLNKNEGDKFENYFEVSDIKNKLSEISRKKAVNLIDKILTEESNIVTIEEIKNKEKLLLSKLDKIAESVKNVFTEKEKEVLLSYFKKSIT
jgi:hypothetical protein